MASMVFRVPGPKNAPVRRRNLRDWLQSLFHRPETPQGGMKAIAHLAFSLGSAIHNLWFINDQWAYPWNLQVNKLTSNSPSFACVEEKDKTTAGLICHHFRNYTNLFKTFSDTLCGTWTYLDFPTFMQRFPFGFPWVHLEEPKVEDVVRSAQMVLPRGPRKWYPTNALSGLIQPDIWEHFHAQIISFSINKWSFSGISLHMGLSQRSNLWLQLLFSTYLMAINLRPYIIWEEHISIYPYVSFFLSLFFDYLPA